MCTIKYDIPVQTNYASLVTKYIHAKGGLRRGGLAPACGFAHACASIYNGRGRHTRKKGAVNATLRTKGCIRTTSPTAAALRRGGGVKKRQFGVQARSAILCVFSSATYYNNTDNDSQSSWFLIFSAKIQHLFQGFSRVRSNLTGRVGSNF